MESIVSEEEQRACTPVFEIMAPYNTGPSDSEKDSLSNKEQSDCHSKLIEQTLKHINQLFFSSSQDNKGL